MKIQGNINLVTILSIIIIAFCFYLALRPDPAEDIGTLKLANDSLHADIKGLRQELTDLKDITEARKDTIKNYYHTVNRLIESRDDLANKLADTIRAVFKQSLTAAIALRIDTTILPSRDSLTIGNLDAIAAIKLFDDYKFLTFENRMLKLNAEDYERRINNWRKINAKYNDIEKNYNLMIEKIKPAWYDNFWFGAGTATAAFLTLISLTK